MLIQNSYTTDKSIAVVDVEETLQDVSIPQNTVGKVEIDFDHRFNFYGYKVVNDKKKVFCVGQDCDPLSGKIIFHIYNTENGAESVTPIRRRFLGIGNVFDIM
ncbi:hypothetical protein [Acetonema longum]|uniref:Uncharacterized protein n=1 Tax=Acetonema longum DSM 6540 TaxID=1009370 RepID=F7NHJ7_9FIRM|nr:hypothetical protein [Acetonema longum]EGO64487.1 hypothetical protein ALO_07723 [Acetonema longum DSM 6540]